MDATPCNNYTWAPYLVHFGVGTEKEDALVEAIKTRMDENRAARDAAAAAAVAHASAAGRPPPPVDGNK